jgi:hypothetical protein
MGAHQASVSFEPAIWARLVEAPKEPVPPDAARYLLSIQFSEADHARMQELMDKSEEGALSADEESELDSYVNITNFLSVVHSRARVALRTACLPPTHDARNS